MNGNRVCRITIPSEKKRKDKKVASSYLMIQTSVSSCEDIAATSFGTSWFRYVTRSYVDWWNILADDWRHCHGRGERTAFVGSLVPPCIANLVFPSASHAMMRRSHNCRWAFQIPRRGSYACTSRSLPIGLRIAFNALDHSENVCPEFVELLITIGRSLGALGWYAKRPTGSL